MALAGGDAAVSPVGQRSLGNPFGPADEPDSSGAALLLREHLVALHGFIKKTRAAPEADLAMARKRQKELKQ